MSTEPNNEVVVDANLTNTNPSNDDKNIATITHLGGTVFSFLPALIVWILKKDDSAFIADQAKEALNFQITMILAQFTAWILAWILIGFFFMFIFWVFNIELILLIA